MEPFAFAFVFSPDIFQRNPQNPSDRLQPEHIRPAMRRHDIQINAHQSSAPPRETAVSFFFFCVCENDGDPLISQNDLRLSAALLPLLFLSFSIFRLLRGSLMRTHKTGPLLPALTLSIMELFWRLCLRLIFQPHMLALFHLSLPSPSLACDCRDGRNTPASPPPGGSGAICSSRLGDAHSH